MSEEEIQDLIDRAQREIRELEGKLSELRILLDRYERQRSGYLIGGMMILIMVYQFNLEI
jgi:hypothetical protein